MKRLLRLFGLLAGVALLRPGETHAQGTAFSCDGTLYQIRQVGTTSQIFKVDRSTPAYKTTALNIMSNGTSNDLGVLVNGLAYNSQDGYMYALSTAGLNGSNANNTITLYKIGQSGIAQVGTANVTVGNTTTPLSLVVASGTFDKAGNYYFSSQNTNVNTTNNAATAADYNVYVLQPGSTTSPTVATKLTTTNANNYTMYDIAYNPSDNNIYGVNTVGVLYKVAIGYSNGKPASATVTNVAGASSASTNTTDNTPVGSAFFDVAGRMYAYSNGTPATNTAAAVPAYFYQVDSQSGLFTQISSIDPASVSDGASCINPGNAIDVTKDVTNVVAVTTTTFDITYAIRVRNTYTATDQYVQVSDLLKGNTTTTSNVTFPTASSITIQSAPVVTNYNGATLVANTAFTGLSATPTGSSVGGGSLLDGTQPLTAGQSALITYTVRVAFANGVPTTAQNNTAYATSTYTGPNKGYTLLTNDALLSPNDLVANDASTNSADFPALRPADANGNSVAQDSPSPTPVTFAPSISGTVFEDVNYGGGLGRSLGASQGAPRSGATVELYSGSGATATYVRSTTTDANGNYSFTGLTAGASYVVRVVNSTVTSSRNTGNASGLVAVQTYRTSANATSGTSPDLSRVGGEYPARTDAAAVTSTTTTLASLNLATDTTATESIAAVTLSGGANSSTAAAPAVDVDFGYNFDTVVNTNDSGQGSLRQFITNANALQNSVTSSTGTVTYLIAQAAASTANAPTPAAGVETSIFMIPDGNAHEGLTAYSLTTNPGLASQLTNGVAVINPTTALPALSGTYAASTSIDGTTQTQNVGNTNNVALGTGGTVGTQGTALVPFNGPEVQVQGPTTGTAIAVGLDVGAANATIKGLSVLDFGSAGDSDDYASIRVRSTGALLTGNVIGTTASSFAAPATISNSDGIRLTPASGTTTITNNLIGFNRGKGVAVDAGVTGTVITGNEVDANAQGNPGYGAIDIQGSSATVTNNLLLNNAQGGIDSYNSSGSNVIQGNTVSGNGFGTSTSVADLTAGVRIFGTGNTVSQNVIYSNYGAGILLSESATNTANTTLLSQNSIYNNGNLTAPPTRSNLTTPTTKNTAASGEIGIDLLANSDVTNGTGPASLSGKTPYVTYNSSSTAGTNSLLNYPILQSATLVGNNLLVQGYAKAGVRIELFTAQANPSSVNTVGANFGQGKTYLTSVLEGGTLNGVSDTNSSTGQSYGQNNATVNGFYQGSDTNANGFSFLIPLTADQVAAVKANLLLTSTATANPGTTTATTSEFSGNVTTSITAPLTGYVFEDVNYGGGAGRPRTASGAVTRPGAKVELYDSNGNYVSTAITDANGQYSFSALPGSYTVRVVDNSVLSSRTGATSASGSATTGYVSNQIPVQTYNGTTSRVGGERPEYTDAAANSGSQTLASLTSGTTLPESIATGITVTQGASSNAGPDFGFNFDLVVNTNDVALGSTTAQGSLRQFIANSNALGGEGSLAQVYTNGSGATTALASGFETSIFMIPNGTTVPGQQSTLTNQFTASSNLNTPNTGLSGSAAIIKLNSALAAATGTTVTGPNTVIDGSTQTNSTGDTNKSNTTAGSESTGAEVLLNLNGQSGLALNGNNDQLQSMGVYGSPLGSQGVAVGSGVTGVTLNNNTIYSNGANIVLNTNAAATITNNVIRNSTRTTTNVSGVTIAGDGISLQGGNNNMTISGNQILNNGAFGINFTGTDTGNTVSGNTISGNGTATAGTRLAGISLRGSGSNNNVFTSNTITSNNGAGIVAQAGTLNNVFSQNSFSGNGVTSGANNAGKGLGIDLAASGAGDDGDGVTVNDTSDADAAQSTNGANGLINFPILQTASLNGTTLTVTGYARPSTKVELYLAAADPTGFGEGQQYLTTFTQATTAGTNGSVVTTAASTYGASNAQINGLYQGTDNTLGFTYTVTLTSAQAAAIKGGKLTSTATLLANDGNGNYGTSEFSGNVPVAIPLPVELAAFTVQAATRDAQLNWITASELNNDHFDVERSLDGSTFSKIGRVAGQGSKATASTYRFTDAGIGSRVASGQVVYYRLAQVDRDGTTAYSPVRSTSFAAATASVVLYPNPAASATSLDLSALPAGGTYRVLLLDATGRQVQQTTVGGGLVQPLSLSNLATGTYQVLVSGTQADGTSFRQVLRLSKE